MAKHWAVRERRQRLLIIRDFLKKDPGPHDLNYLAAMFAVNWGVTKRKVLEYFRVLEEAGFITIRNGKVSIADLVREAERREKL